jgi:hypothetical protein
MSCHSGPKGITSGLILHLDAANRKSNRRVSTLNLEANPEDMSTYVGGATAISCSSNIAVAPDGNTTADKLFETTAVNSIHIFGHTGFLTTGVTYRLSFFAKAVERYIVGAGSNNGLGSCVVNLNTGVVLSGSASIEIFANGWYRINTILIPGGGQGIYMGICDNTGSNTYTGDGSSGLYIWGVQVEIGTTLTPYYSASSWSDQSGQNYHATMTSTPVAFNTSGFWDYTVNSPAITSTATPAGGCGFTFSSPIIPLSGSFTIFAFIRRNPATKAVGDRETIFSNTGGSNGWRFGLGANGSLYYLIGDSLAYQEGGLGGSTLQNGNWHMICGVFDRAATLGTYTVYGYIDGVLSGQVAIVAGASAIAMTAQNGGVGYRGCCDIYAGHISALFAYNFALSATDVLWLFNAHRGRYGL